MAGCRGRIRQLRRARSGRPGSGRLPGKDPAITTGTVWETRQWPVAGEGSGNYDGHGLGDPAVAGCRGRIRQLRRARSGRPGSGRLSGKDPAITTGTVWETRQWPVAGEGSGNYDGHGLGDPAVAGCRGRTEALGLRCVSLGTEGGCGRVFAVGSWATWFQFGVWLSGLSRGR